MSNLKGRLDRLEKLNPPEPDAEADAALARACWAEWWGAVQQALADHPQPLAIARRAVEDEEAAWAEGWTPYRVAALARAARHAVYEDRAAADALNAASTLVARRWLAEDKRRDAEAKA